MDIVPFVIFGAIIVAVFAVGIGAQIAFDRRFGVRRARHDAGAQQHQQAVRGQFGAPGSQGPQQ